MANTLVQFRIDAGLRRQANDLCMKLGLDLTTYLRMSLARLVQEQGVPFSLKLSTAPSSEDAVAAMKKISDLARANGTAGMSLNEINAEIAATRKRRK